MTYYVQRGEVPPKRHTRHLVDGRLTYEELMGQEGFSGSSSLLYHRHPPAAVVAARQWPTPSPPDRPNVPLLPRHLRPHDLLDDDPRADAVTGRRPLLGNDDLRIDYVRATATSPLYRNAVGDECCYVEAGNGRLESVCGPLPVGPGDFVIVPRGVTHRWAPAPGDPLHLLCLSAGGHIRPPRRYLSATGQFLEHAPYCERDLRLPGEPPVLDDRDVEVFVAHRTPGGVAGTVHVADRHPFDVVGWAGALYPYAFNVADFEPITGRVHQPPPVHQVFEGDGFVVCAFVPRKVDYHPLAIPVPYYHANVDSEEVMFYCGGEYGARRGSGVGLGSLTVHPGGFVHGPQPAAYEASSRVERVDELAVMVDTFRPLLLGEAALACEDGTYPWSWAGGPRRVEGR